MIFETGPNGFKDPKTGEWIKSRAEADRRALQYHEENNVKAGMNADGSAKRPEYESLVDQATGLLKDQYQLKAPTIDPNSLQGYQAVKNEALRTGPSAWMNLAMQKQADEEASANDKAVQNARQGEVNARSTLAMRGGLSSGARERLAQNAGNQAMYAKQDVGNQGRIARSALGLQDEQNRMGFLKDFSKAEGDLSTFNATNTAKTQEFNILKGIEDKRAKDSHNLEVYKEQMEKWAANKQADATQAAGGGGGK